MRRRILVVIVVAGLLADVVLANIPGPVPSAQAVMNVEHDPIFLSLLTRVINGSVVNGTYAYLGYSNDVGRDFYCVHNLYEMGIHYFNPFHQYTTTSLGFAVSWQTRPVPPYALYAISLFIQVNPSTGQVLNVDQDAVCAGPPPPP